MPGGAEFYGFITADSAIGFSPLKVATVNVVDMTI